MKIENRNCPLLINQKIFIFWCVTILFSFGSCAIFQKDRVTKNRGISKTNFNLPLIIYPSKTEGNKTMIVFLSGDGGWLDLDDELAVGFANDGFNTVGFNSRSYFWVKKTPKQAALDISLLIQTYLKDFNCKNLILCGYSFGADVVPFIYNNLNIKERSKVKSLILLSPFASTDFVVYPADLVNLGGDNREFKVILEAEKIKIPISCYYGKDESIKPLSSITKRRFHQYILDGGHKYSKDGFKIIISNLTRYNARIN
jgi:type IV secretory pathway VirJ component